MEVGSEVSIIRSTRVVVNDVICPADVVIQNGKIVEISAIKLRSRNIKEKVLDVGNQLVMPGIVDSHVHVNEPGRTEWEGYWTATRAAAAGGITTVVDMPLNSIPPTTTLENFETKLEAAQDNCFVDVAFWGGVIPGNQNELYHMIQAGVSGFKCFMIHSGVEEFPHVTDRDLHDAMAQLQDTESVLLFHAEKEIHQKRAELDADPCEYDTFLNSRPDVMEAEAVKRVTDLCLQYDVRCHIVHLSSADTLDIIEAARQAGAPLTVETTHHYLTLAAEHIPPGATHFKCCPPIRSKENQEKLWEALKDGRIDMVVSDHSPCTADLKLLQDGDFMKAWGGISSLQFGLPLFWTASQRRGLSVKDVIQLMCQNTAKLAGLEDRKGSLTKGKDADIVIWDPDKEFEVKEDLIHHRNKLTPYLGFRLHGEVYATIVQGKLVYLKGRFSPRPLGELLLVRRRRPEKTSQPYY